ncbi:MULTISPECIES: caspase family protein [unclassified Bradyrhizobium]|uniref:caspase family protein n=1 Tax=unclassified Bradyrhizobium TaxID=2631580 RepID=UPI002915D4EE|nr:MULTISPECIES: caspase family protein [unclassified Bradyrhizobium]
MAANTAAGKVQAVSVHIGLNAVDSKHYGGWSGDLVACESDAQDMAAIARAAGMNPTLLLTKQASRANVLEAVRAASKALRSGDLLFVSYSGHGGQIPDVTGEEEDKLDETWCLYDGELIDDEVFLELSRFSPNVRILVLSDSCHSGTVVRARVPEGVPVGRSKMMPPTIAMRTYREHQAFYDKLQLDAAKAAGKASVPTPDSALARVAVSKRLTAIANECKACVILISGCQDNQTSMDGDHNGAFTEQLLQVWNQGAFKGNYAQFHAAIKARMPRTQVPNLFTLGPVGKFLTESPFSL